MLTGLASLFTMISRTQFDLYLKTSRGLIKPSSFNGVVYLLHNENFEIVLSNNTWIKVKAKIILCGHDIGTLVLKPKEIIPLKKVVEGIDRCFRYCEFDSYEGMLGKLDKDSLYSDEITVVYMPQKEIIVDRSVCGTPKFCGIRVETDFSPAHDMLDGCVAGGAVLGPTKTHQRFYRVDDFPTEGEYRFTIVMRSRQHVEDVSPMILPLSENVLNV